MPVVRGGSDRVGRNMTEHRVPRDDLLVSVGLAQSGSIAVAANTIRDIAARLSERFRYWEIVVIADGNQSGHLKSTLAGLANLRLIAVRGSTGYYRRRAIAAAEAIGDVVVLTSAEEAGNIDLAALAENAISSGEGIICTRARGQITGALFAPLGLLSGFRVSPRDLMTAAYPRSLINRLLAHPDRDLALRFPPRNEGIPVRAATIEWLDRHPRGLGLTTRRLGLVQKLLINSTPRLLSGMAILSSVVFFAALAYSAYAVAVQLLLDDVEPGWFTTALLQGLTTAYLACGMLVLTMGMQRVLDHLSPSFDDVILDESSGSDLFAGADERNVTTQAARAETVPGKER